MAFRHRCDVYTARLMSAQSLNCAARTMVPPLYGILIARWRHGRWCHLCGKGPCLYSTRGPTGSLLVSTIREFTQSACKQNCQKNSKAHQIANSIILHKFTAHLVPPIRSNVIFVYIIIHLAIVFVCVGPNLSFFRFDDFHISVLTSV